MNTNNIAFSKQSAYPLWDIVNGKMLIIAGYARDHVGGTNNNSTTFTTGAKNGDNPNTWGTTVGNVNTKSDLLDVFTAFLRNGDSVYDTLYLVGSIATTGTNGDRNFDFEYNQTAFAYEPSTGTWSNLGPDGGHTAWRFDSTKKTSQVGDLILACDWTTNAGLASATIKLWTHDSFHTPGDTMDGKFVWGPDFVGTANGYGYAAVTVPPGTITSMQNDSVGQGQNPGARTLAGPWGAKTSTGVYDTAYDAHQYLDFAINLTLMGVDPAILTTLNDLGEPDPCTPIYYSFMAKSRTSSAFTAALKDFTTPITFDVPDLTDLTTVLDTSLNCRSINNIELEGFSSSASLYSNPTYRWTTTNGNIVGATSTGITGDTIYANPAIIDQPGTYLVSLSKFAGCGVDDIDTVTVVNDEVYPIATAWTTLDTANKDSLYLYDSLRVNNNHMLFIQGGDTAASRIATSVTFPSEGFSFSWTGVSAGSSGFIAKLQKT